MTSITPESIANEWKERYPKDYMAALGVGRDPAKDIKDLAVVAFRIGCDPVMVRADALAEAAPWRANEAIEALISKRKMALRVKG